MICGQSLSDQWMCARFFNLILAELIAVILIHQPTARPTSELCLLVIHVASELTYCLPVTFGGMMRSTMKQIATIVKFLEKIDRVITAPHFIQNLIQKLFINQRTTYYYTV